MSTKSCIDCREKDSEIRDLKEKFVKLETEKADCREKDSEIRDLKEKVATLSKYASKLEMEKAKLIHQEESLVNIAILFLPSAKNCSLIFIFIFCILLAELFYT